jgi:phospholipase C
VSYIIGRDQSSDTYTLWRASPDAPAGRDLFEQVAVKEPTLPAGTRLAGVGNYLLSWAKLTGSHTNFYPYQLLDFDPTRDNPLGAIQVGVWPMEKFWGTVADFGNPSGADKEFQKHTELLLYPMGSFLLNFIPTDGRGTFRLFNFDPGQVDPLPATPYYPQGAFSSIDARDELLPIGGYVLTRRGAAFRLWSFDSQAKIPLAHPVVQEGQWSQIDERHQLLVVGEHVLDYLPETKAYRLWRFDPTAKNALTGPVRRGKLPAGLAGQQLTAFSPRLPAASAAAEPATPGTIEWMRAKIQHVVYYMLENRSFDHICGWLYEKDAKNLQFIGSDRPFAGATPTTTKYNGGKLTPDFALDLPQEDPYHDYSDVMRQLFGERPGAYEAYRARKKPDMSGFLWNNGNQNVMGSYTPEQVPVLNGLAKGFALSDEWFCSMPGGTDVNRAFSLSGNSLGELNNFQNGVEYTQWPSAPHRPSVFKTLWSYGIDSFKIYNSIEWMNFVFTQHLFLAGQIPSVDASSASYVASYQQFLADAASGSLPAFSYLEPTWIGSTGTSSYHPGADLVPGEQQLSDIYEALRRGPRWEQTLLVVTFDEHGGIYDHVPPPYATNPYPNDEIDGFKFDLMGVRVPTLLISPWIDERTVFRSPTDVAYDATSFLATLLRWFGVPRSGWGLGERTNHAPTFEGVLRRKTPRPAKSLPSPKVPHDAQNPGASPSPPARRPPTDLDRLMTFRVLAAELPHLPAAEVKRLADDVLARAKDLTSLHVLVRATIRSQA